MKRPSWRVWAALLAAALLAVAAAAWYGFETARERRAEHERGTGPRRYVPVSWKDNRSSPGHSVHLAQGIECDSCHTSDASGFDKPDSAVCSICHAAELANLHAGSAAHPTTCTTCHVFALDNPGFSPWACTRCHSEEGALGESDLHAHTSVACSECHRPHGAEVIVMQDCTTCHSSIRTDHGHHEAAVGTCTGCHAPHTAADEATSCESCHERGKFSVPHSALFASGHVACTSCHKPHVFVASARRSCASCHQAQQAMASAAPHVGCTQCHAPHAVTAGIGNLCARCHTNVHVDHPMGTGTAQCLACHQPHHVQTSPLGTCQSCHEAHGDKHDPHALEVACVKCHTPHRVTIEVRSNAFCVGCHEAKVDPELVHGGHEQCTTCHGASLHAQTQPPTCQTCHSTATLPGLHQIPKHQQCALCHTAHEKRPQAFRQTCVGCHTKMTHHEPNATRCEGCHTFRN